MTPQEERRKRLERVTQILGLAWPAQRKAEALDAMIDAAVEQERREDVKALVDALEAVLRRDGEGSPSGTMSGCCCVNVSRTAEREYETCRCPHQRAAKLLERARADAFIEAAIRSRSESPAAEGEEKPGPCGHEPSKPTHRCRECVAEAAERIDARQGGE